MVEAFVFVCLIYSGIIGFLLVRLFIVESRLSGLSTQVYCQHHAHRMLLARLEVLTDAHNRTVYWVTERCKKRDVLEGDEWKPEGWQQEDDDDA